MSKLSTGNTRLLWGVRLYSRGEKPSGILFKPWAGKPQEKLYAGEPVEPLLFTTKKHALDWCRTRNAEYKSSTDSIVSRLRIMVCRVAVDVKVSE